MKTYDLKQAAEILKMSPESLREKAKNGTVPAAKPGKRWCFCEDDLAQYLQKLYSSNAKASQGVIEVIRRNKWHSTSEKISGGLTSITAEKEYSKVLGLQTK